MQSNPRLACWIIVAAMAVTGAGLLVLPQGSAREQGPRNGVEQQFAIDGHRQSAGTHRAAVFLARSAAAGSRSHTLAIAASATGWAAPGRTPLQGNLAPGGDGGSTFDGSAHDARLAIVSPFLQAAVDFWALDAEATRGAAHLDGAVVVDGDREAEARSGDWTPELVLFYPRNPQARGGWASRTLDLVL